MAHSCSEEHSESPVDLVVDGKRERHSELVFRIGVTILNVPHQLACEHLMFLCPPGAYFRSSDIAR